MLTNKLGGTLYVGVTNNLVRRVLEHRDGKASMFTKKYRLHRLVWWEAHENVEEAIQREKRLKKWKRVWKIELIEELNPNWLDLFPALTQSGDYWVTGLRG